MYVTKTLLLSLTVAVLSATAADVTTNPAPIANPAAHLRPSAWTFLDQKTMEYSFGRMIAKYCVGLQVTIANSDAQHDLIVHSITLRFGSDKEYPVSSLDKVVLDGLTDRAQSVDPRNLTLRILRGAGVIAATVGTFASVGPAFSPVIAAFNGPFMSAYTGIFPDYTVNQLIRVGNAAFSSNKVVTKSNSEVVMAFIPIKMMFNEKDRKLYRHEPHDLLVKTASTIQIDIDGTHVVEVASN